MKMRFRFFSAAVAASVGLMAQADLPNWTVTWSEEDPTVGTCSNDQNSFVLNVYRDADSAHQGFGLAIGAKTGATKGSAVASVDGLEYLDLRGSISGLDPRVDPATNAVWKFSRFTGTCFSPNNGTALVPAQNIVGLHSPGTLVADTTLNTFHVDSGDRPKKTKEIIIDEPNVTTSLGGWYLNDAGNLTNLIYRVPKATLWASPTSHGASNWSTDFGLWDVSGIKHIGSTSKSSALGTYSGPLPSSVPNAKGTLRLPSLVHISAGASANEAAAFYGVAMREVELGLAGNLEYLANYSFKACNSLTNVVIGASPAGKTLTICQYAFWCTALKNIYFNGEKPDIKGVPESPSFGSLATPEGQITFYVRDIPSWAAVLAEADANGGFVSGATMGTANRQKVVRFPGIFKTTVELQDPRFAEIYHEAVTIEASGMRPDGYAVGPVTLTATCSDPDDAATDPRRAKFLRWDGVPVELERQNPLTFTPTTDLVVKAVFAHDWLMSNDAEPNRTMENRFWRVCCWKRSDGDHWLGLGKAFDKITKGSMWPSDPAQRMGGGDLNLNGDIWDSNGEKWSLASVAGMQVWYINGKCPTPKSLYESGEIALLPTRLTLPETLRWWPGEIQNHDSWEELGYVWPMKEIFAIVPLATGSVGSFTIGACGQITRLVIRAPKVTKFGDGQRFGFTWCGSRFAESNFDEWDLSGVTTVADNAFNGSYDYEIKGTLRLPNVQTVGTNAFYRLPYVTGLVLGTNGLTLTSIGDTALTRTTRLTDLAIGAAKGGLAMGSNLGADSIFTGLKALKTLRFPGRALPTEQVDAILTAVPESATTKQVTIYASPLNHWDLLAASLTAEEESSAPDDCFGVYRAGLRKAWFVTERSPYEPKGMCILLR